MAAADAADDHNKLSLAPTQEFHAEDNISEQLNILGSQETNKVRGEDDGGNLEPVFAVTIVEGQMVYGLYESQWYRALVTRVDESSGSALYDIHYEGFGDEGIEYSKPAAEVHPIPDNEL